MTELKKALELLNSKGYIVRVDEETENSCFYVATLGLYSIEFWLDYKEGLNGFWCFHNDVPNFKDKHDTLGGAIIFCADMNKRLEAIEKERKKK